MTTFINILPITAGVSVGGVIGIIFGVIGVLILLIVALIFPGDKKEIDFFTGHKYAHRGLHDAEKAENSMSAFKAAVDHGFGIELDIRLSKDGQLVVFHDDTLDRVCGRPGRVKDFTAEELATFKLSGTEDGIPTFAEVLALVDGQVPLLVEIKEDPNDSAVSVAAIDQLGSYKGLFMVESFNPFTVARVSKAIPDVCSGFLSRHFTKEKELKQFIYYVVENLLTNRLCNPSFIAYAHHDHYMPALKLARLLGARTIAWTVRSKEEEEQAYAHGFDGVIFENYIPEKFEKK
jgi:glycerophosphoryl diester phosphodiesterase